MRVLLFSGMALQLSFAAAQQQPSTAPAPALSSAPAATEERHEDHQALRALLAQSIDALNTRNFDKVAPLLHKHFTVVTVDNQKLTGLDEFKKYWEALFTGPNATLTKVDVHPQADALTEFLDNDTGVTHGVSDDVYHFTNGDTRTMKSRWTVVVEKEGDGWKLAKVHFSTSLLDNPVVDAAKSYTYKAVVIALLAGLAIGAATTALMRRPRPA